MVKPLSADDKAAIAQTIAEAERHTAVEIVTVVAPASDPYQSHVMLYGFVIGSIVATALWATGAGIAFPLLLAVQAATMVAFSLIPPLQRLCARLVPQPLRHHRARQRAYAEYLAILQQAPAGTPVVLVYISIVEHYVHILANDAVREKIPDESWNGAIAELTSAIKQSGLRDACIRAINHIARLTAPHFPDRGEANALRLDVIELGK